MKFQKMYVCGEDFLITLNENNVDYPSLAIKLLNRIKGIGANRLIVCKKNPLEMFIYDELGKRELFNANALVCFGKFVYDNEISRARELNILTGAGMTKLQVAAEIPYMARLNL